MTGRFAQRNLARIGPHSLPCCHETSWQYSVAASGRSVPGRRLGHHRTGAVRHHHRHSTGHTGVQNGGTDVDPVGKTVVYGGGVGSVLINIVWFVLAGVWMALGYVCAGLLNCITIIGIPFGIQSFKMAKLALWPFGSQIYAVN